MKRHVTSMYHKPQFSVFRRTVLKGGAAQLLGVTFLLLPSLLCHAAEVDFGAKRDVKLTGLIQNEDCSHFFGRSRIPAGKAGETVDSYVDVLAGAGVSVLMCNTSSRRTNYRSKVWEAFWDGYDPSQSDDQPFFKTIPLDSRKRFRRRLDNMLAFQNEGVDYPARVIQRCRHHGISPWISLRMNDVHNADNLDHPFHSALWRRPELWRQGSSGNFARALDYAHAEVRDHYRALIAETFERYDVDGLELDFLREPYLFKVGKEQEGRQILTAWMREIRALADAAEKRRGHAVRLGVRVPSCPDTALGLGLDAPLWARKGLVDLVVVAPRWATIEFAMPLKQWRKLLGERVTLAGGLEILYRPTLAMKPRVTTREELTGAAIAVLSDDADVVYLFNCFQSGRVVSEYQSMLNSFRSLDELIKLPSRHGVTFRDVRIPGQNFFAPLPARGTRLSFDLPLGPVRTVGWQIETEIEVVTSKAGYPLTGVSINGVAGTPLRRETLKNGNDLVAHAFPDTVLSGKTRDTVIVMAEKKLPVKVQRVEVSINLLK